MGDHMDTYLYHFKHSSEVLSFEYEPTDMCNVTLLAPLCFS